MGDDDLDLASAQDREGLAALLRTVHARAGRPSLQTLEERLGGTESKSTLADMLTGSRFPKQTVMAAFLTACDLTAEQVAAWDLAWQRIAGTEHRRAAAEIEAPHAMVDLGLLERGHGDLAAARHWFEEAIATQHPEHAPAAMINLAFLDWMQKDFPAARRRYMEAIATGHAEHAPAAMINLGPLEKKLGDPAAARRWYMEAIATQHPEHAPAAMINLGLLEKGQGDPAAARRWYRQAIAATTQYPDFSAIARSELEQLDRDDQAQRHAAWYAKYGHQYIDPTIMRRPPTSRPGSDHEDNPGADDPPQEAEQPQQ
ncbi:tetratricopeptide repeat protein [Streptosporangiaceae bacterium NEAU-GS5]|nr:tetratricopeptide repeat protein [Streptosporangiaceae bacterium NEAU-GS5]